MELNIRILHDLVSTEHDDKSDTVMTGFNTDDPIDPYDEFLIEKDKPIKNTEAKSEGAEAKVPFLREDESRVNNLEAINEGNESADYDIEESPYAKPNITAERSPAVRLNDDPRSSHPRFGIKMQRLMAVERNHKMDIEALLSSIEREQRNNKKINRAMSLKDKKRKIEDAPDSEWNDLPDPVELPSAKLTQKQKLEETTLRTILLNNWDEVFTK